MAKVVLFWVVAGVALCAVMLWHYPALRQHEQVRMEVVRDTYQHPWDGGSHGPGELVADGGRPGRWGD